MAAAHAAVRNKKGKKAVEVPDDVPVMFADAPNEELRRINLEKKNLNAQVHRGICAWRAPPASPSPSLAQSWSQEGGDSADMCDNAQGVVSWGLRGAVLTQSWLTFYDDDEPTYTTEIERIPLIEVFRLSSKYAEENSSSRDSFIEVPSREMVFLVCMYACMYVCMHV